MWHQLQYLSDRHTVSLAALVYSDTESTDLRPLSDYCEDLQFVRCQGPKRFLGEQPRLVAECNREAMWSALEALPVRGFDVVIIEHIFMAQYRRIFDVPVALQEHNVESEVLHRYAVLDTKRAGPASNDWACEGPFHDAGREWRAMARYERLMWPTFDLRIAVSSRDKSVMDRICPVGANVVIENGTSCIPIPPRPNSDAATILFMGTLDYYPNLDAVDFLVGDILPAIWAGDASVRLCIAGRNPPRRLERLSTDARIRINGNPEDMGAVAAECSLSVVPLRIGGGTRIKILDSMAMGLPVVSTSVGCEGLAVQDGVHLSVANDARTMAHAILRILGDERLKYSFRSNGMRLVDQGYRWRLKCEELESALVALGARGRS